MASVPLLQKDHTVYPVGRHSDTHFLTGFAVSIIHSEMDEGTERREVGLTEMLNNVGTLALY